MKKLDKIDGFIVTPEATIRHAGPLTVHDRNRSVYRYKKQAEKALAMAELSQYMAEMNKDWTPDWTDKSQAKVCIYFDGEFLSVRNKIELYQFLTFPGIKPAMAFLDEHYDLILTFFEQKPTT